MINLLKCRNANHKILIITMTHSSSSQKIPFGAAKLSQDFATLINSRQGSDIQFKVGGGYGKSTLSENGETIYDELATVTLYAHSLILRCRSRYFAAMLDEDKHWKESSNGIIYKPNISPSTFQDVLHYIYTGNVRAKSSENIIELITAADEMDLEELSEECQAELIRTVKYVFSDERSKNARISIDIAIQTHIIPALNLASSHSLSHLTQKLQEIMLPHMSVIIESPGAYTAFINGISSEALSKIIASDNLAMTERSVWDLALSWGCYQINLSKAAVEAQLSNPEDEDSDESSSEAIISATQLDQLKAKIVPLLPSVRFSLLDSDDYHEIIGIVNYFLPRRRSHELNRFFVKPDRTRLLDTPRSEIVEQKITSKIIVESTVWKFLRKKIFETGGINNCPSLNHLKFNLLFRASENNFLTTTFHRRCDNKGPTLVLVKSTDGHLFGGVNFNHWKSDADYYSSSPLNFLFALPDGRHRKNSEIIKIEKLANVPYSSYNHLNYGPTFGAGHDLFIAKAANTDQRSYSNMPSTYTGSGASNTTLAGAKHFMVSDYEVFAISKNNCLHICIH